MDLGEINEKLKGCKKRSKKFSTESILLDCCESLILNYAKLSKRIKRVTKELEESTVKHVGVRPPVRVIERAPRAKDPPSDSSPEDLVLKTPSVNRVVTHDRPSIPTAKPLDIGDI